VTTAPRRVDANQPYHFDITGVVKPYVRMTRRGKWVRPDALEYLASRADIARQMQHAMAVNDWPMLPEHTPLWCSIVVTRSQALHKCDLDNIVKAVLDAAQGIVFRNDCWIDAIEARRELAETDAVVFTVAG
jgi:Holliday junction resolvase RusA-like endonuclease